MRYDGSVDHSPSPTPKSFGLAVAIVTAGAIVALVAYVSQSTLRDIPDSLTAAAPSKQVEKVAVPISPHDPVLGAPAAPVTMIMFSDWQCPYCSEWHRSTLPQLKERYIDPGRVRLVFKDFPLIAIHPDAQLAAEAGQCAHAQGKFWEYGAVLTRSGASLDQAHLQAAAQEVQLDDAQFADCINTHQSAANITANVQAGITAGVTSTPTFIINGVILEGAQPLSVLAAAIAAAE